MNTLTKGIAVAVIHVLIVLSLGGKLLYDRKTRPRVWVKTASVDPDLPIRGRYLTLSLLVLAPDLPKPAGSGKTPRYGLDYVTLAVENNRLVAHKSDPSSGMFLNTWNRNVQPAEDTALLVPAVDFFLPEHAEVPRLKPGEEIWAEVTVPRKGPPRPIQLALKRGTEWTPLTYR